MIFDLIKTSKFSELKKYIMDNSDLDLDVYDEQNIFFIQYLVRYNQIDIINYIKTSAIRIDIVDIDGRNLLYESIKYNNIHLFDILIECDKIQIGLSIINIRDNIGYTCFHYSILFNNLIFFKKIYHLNGDVNVIDNDKNTLFMFCLQYKRSEFFIYLLENELKKSTNILNYINSNNESILHNAIIYDNKEALNYIIEQTDFVISIINKCDTVYGLSALIQCIVLEKNIIALQLIKLGANINISDYIGNSPIHYAIIEKNFNFLQSIFEMNINISEICNKTNLNGDTILHIFLDMDVITTDIENVSVYQYNYLNFFETILINTNINIMNNKGITPLHIIANKNLWTINSIKQLLTNNLYMNLFITSNNNNNVLDIIPSKLKPEFINIAIDSYYNILKKLKNEELHVNWEKYCRTNDLDNIIILYNKTHKSKENKDISYYCKEYIRDMIVNMKRSMPLLHEIDLNIDSGVFTDGCFYTGSSIDILFGLVYLFKNFDNVDVILTYPLTENKELDTYYKRIGLNYSYKINFSNIEIIWSFQKLIYITNFDTLLKYSIDTAEHFIIIPLGIEVATGSHANIIIIDTENKTIERFEPNGKNSPGNLYYNMELLDNMLEIKFNSLTQYKYIRPGDFLPDIGFQILETLEDNICKKIGDPNGFCAVWCIWWVEQRITNSKIKPNILVTELINTIRFANKSFKNLIRNYSIKITHIRDEYLKKYKLTINDWILTNYTEDNIASIEKDVLSLL